MSKQIHPGVAAVVLTVAFLLVLFVYYKRTEPPPPMPMNPRGPGAGAMRKAGGDMSQYMSPAEKAMTHKPTSGPGGSPNSAPPK